MTTFREMLYQFAQLFRWFVMVAPWEQALRIRLGKHVTALGGGIHWRIPVIDRIYRQSVRRRFSQVPTQTLTTKDGKTATLGGSLGYCIVDIKRLYDTLHDAEDTIAQETMGMIAQYIVSRTLSELTAEGIQKHVSETLDLSQYGLGDQRFVLTDFVVTRTYRIIQGERADWKKGRDLNTSDYERADQYE